MPDWAKLADKGKEYSNKGIDKGKKAYQNSKSAPTNKASPFEPPKQIVSLDHQPARNTAVSLYEISYYLTIDSQKLILHHHHCVRIVRDHHQLTLG